MAGVAAQATYSTDIIAVQRVFYGEIFSFACKLTILSSNFPSDNLTTVQWMLTVATMSIGLSLSGIMYRFLVTPPSMSKPQLEIPFSSLTAPPTVWQNTLVECALLNTLHSQQYAGIGGHRGPSRVKFFLMAFIGAVLWCMLRFLRRCSKVIISFAAFFPSYLFTALRLESLPLRLVSVLICICNSVFSWVIISPLERDGIDPSQIFPCAKPCWIAPNNIVSYSLFYEKLVHWFFPRKSINFLGNFEYLLCRSASLTLQIRRINSGLGLSFVTFDWNQIAYIESPYVFQFVLISCIWLIRGLQTGYTLSVFGALSLCRTCPILLCRVVRSKRSRRFHSSLRYDWFATAISNSYIVFSHPRTCSICASPGTFSDYN